MTSHLFVLAAMCTWAAAELAKEFVTDLGSPAGPVGSSYVPVLGGQFSHWSAWTRCSRRCEQARSRTCTRPNECGLTSLREKRTCARSRGRECQALSYKLVGTNSRKIQDKLYDLIYRPWADWSPCRKSCRQQRRRHCKFQDVCANSYIQEERTCQVKSSACLNRFSLYLHGNSSSVTSHDDVIPTDSARMADVTSAQDKNVSTREKWSHFQAREGKRRSRSRKTRGEKQKRRKKRKRRPRPSRRRGRNLKLCGLRPSHPGSPSRGSYRVVGGQEVTPHSWPWQVAIITARSKEHFCGGTLIASRWVLTAAHCVRKRDRARKFLVRVGSHNVKLEKSDFEFTEDIRPVLSLPHPKFDYPTISNDIALVKLQHAPSAFTRARHACLPRRNFRPQKLCYIVGWGKTRSKHVVGSARLREAQVPVVGRARCQGTLGYKISRRQVCAGFRRGGPDSCAGDSGGPLLCDTSRGAGRYAIFGVTSYGEGCGRRGKFGIYTRVGSYRDWIRRTMRDNT